MRNKQIKFNLVLMAFMAVVLVSCGTGNTPNESNKTKKTDPCTEEGHNHGSAEASKKSKHIHDADCAGDHHKTEVKEAAPCQDHDHAQHTHEAVSSDDHEGHNHGAEVEIDAHAGHDHGTAKMNYTAYSSNFELFAEADPFVIGHTANILAHFSTLPNYKALESGSITVSLIVDGMSSSQTLAKPTRKGIYSFDLKAKKSGKGKLVFNLVIAQKEYQVEVPNITVYTNDGDAGHAAAEAEVSQTNAIVFTKEQSWKIDFATELPRIEPFGQVIKTTAVVQPVQSNEVVLTAKSNGMISIASNAILEGIEVKKGDPIFQISGKGLAENNSAVRYAEAKNNFEMAKSEYERAIVLSKDKIVSEKALLEAKNRYENAKVVFENLEGNFSLSGQIVVSPISGFIKHLHVQNGQYVDAGARLAMVSSDKIVVLKAEVQQKYASVLGAVSSANIRSMNGNNVFTLEELDGKILSYGRAANEDNHLIPIYLQIENRGDFMVGGFVDIYLRTITNQNAITIPNTALLEEQGVYFVIVQITPELFEKLEVKPLATDGLRTEVSGITVSERVVSKGAIMVKLSKASGELDAHSGHVH
ncbi:MAG: efflux RND transporter periplasmic adaptor subunit [Salinivirgaceae bacterium]|nr:efflux RND transporter periplasmic adaptor subunit [Salinivirgaceae bacterium]